MSESHPSAGMMVARFSRLNRYADPLPENYKDQVDPALSREIADSFFDHIRSYASERGARITASLHSAAPTMIEVKNDKGADIEIRFYGDDAFDLSYGAEQAILTPEGNFLFRTFWTELDRSGLAFLSHMFVDEGHISVPDEAGAPVD